MSVMGSLITSASIVNSTFNSGKDQRKHQSSASLAFVRGIPRSPVNSPHNVPVTRKMFPFNDFIMKWYSTEAQPLMTGAVALHIASHYAFREKIPVKRRAFYMLGLQKCTILIDHRSSQWEIYQYCHPLHWVYTNFHFSKYRCIKQSCTGLHCCAKTSMIMVIHLSLSPLSIVYGNRWHSGSIRFISFASGI